MTDAGLIFEETSSPMYYSNDRRVYVEKTTHPDDATIALPRTVWVVKKVESAKRGNDEVVFATYDRVKVDAYIAGYDEATREYRVRDESDLGPA